MMLGGGLMFGVGLLVMLVVIGLPILLVVALLGGTSGLQPTQNQPVPLLQNSPPAGNSTLTQPSQPASAPARYCSHCGAGLQADWTHCPQCGAPA